MITGLCNFQASCWFTLIPPLLVAIASDPAFFSLKNLQTKLANALWHLYYLRFLAISSALPFETLSEIVFLSNSLLSEYLVSWAKQALSNWFLYKWFKLSVSLECSILSWCLVSCPQAIYD